MDKFRAIEHSPVPLHSQVRQRLRERILDGTYQPNSQLPAESEISAIFSVSRITVRQALSDLQKEGLIFKVAGKGTFVAQGDAYQELTQLEGFAEAMSRHDRLVFNHVLSQETVPADAQVAVRLGIAPGARVHMIRRLRCLDRTPVSIDITYLPVALGEKLRPKDLASRDLFVILEQEFGIALGHADVRIGAVNAIAEQAEALQVEISSALIRVERLTHDVHGTPIDFEYLYIRGDSFQYRLQIARQKRVHRAFVAQ